MITIIYVSIPGIKTFSPFSDSSTCCQYFNSFVFDLFLKQKRGLLFANLFFILILPYVLLLIKLRPIELEKIRSVAIQ